MPSLIPLSSLQLQWDLTYVADSDSFKAGLSTSTSPEPGEGIVAVFPWTDSSGNLHYISCMWVRNTSGASIPQYSLCEIPVGKVIEVKSCATTKTPVRKLAGIAVNTMADTQRSWVVIDGVYPVLDSGSGFTAGDHLRSTATSGKVATANIANLDEYIASFAIALETAAASETKLARIKTV